MLFIVLFKNRVFEDNLICVGVSRICINVGVVYIGFVVRWCYLVWVIVDDDGVYFVFNVGVMFKRGIINLYFIVFFCR